MVFFVVVVFLNKILPTKIGGSTCAKPYKERKGGRKALN
jgi:hypothetical protein